MTRKAASPKKTPARKTASKKAIPPHRATTPKVAVSARDATKIASLLKNPPKPNKALRKAATLADLLAKGESDRLVLQTEAAINLAIGYVMHRCGERVMSMAPNTLREFSRLHKVEVTDRGGIHTYVVTERT